MSEYVYSDGGRSEAGYKGTTGDCAARAIAIATGESYQSIYDAINELAELERPRKNARRSNARLGVRRSIVDQLLKQRDFVWVSTMGIGTGCQVHVRADELPLEGTLVLRLSRHFAEYVDGVLHDSHDSSREGTRCVYGYWVKSYEIVRRLNLDG